LLDAGALAPAGEVDELLDRRRGDVSAERGHVTDGRAKTGLPTCGSRP
jgi:hypothetical protein